ncbi:uncharacterized protein F4822DRAFT_424695 [Hypoxylon trugodes]|uniref:uncharacterized protein n=1 Tax=Hypoxylon trugodes TaxID=326681 RepID=UPI002198C855|nr:uncharacterized protein F4822DRAFT_424695 [Hypoxylon trugodes]KAI1394219.1 hypothetical protein F4822DRAFT_424695 [Hypoxylon trugodes]
MAPHRKAPSPTESDSGSEVDLSIDLQYKPSSSIPQAMENIDKWKSKRSEIQKGIEKDYVDKLTVLKNKIKAYYQNEAQKTSDHSQQRVERLIAALEKRIACEEKISKRIDSLRDDCAHIAMLVDAIYTGRKEAATQSAKTCNPNPPKD